MELQEIKSTTIQKNSSLLFFVGLLGIFLNQSNVMFGFNLSLADFSIIAIVILLLLNEKFDLPAKMFAFFFLFSFFLLLNSTLFIPLLYPIPVGRSHLLKDFFKLAVSLLYFTTGLHIAKFRWSEVLLKWFFLFSTFTGLIGITLFFVPIGNLADMMLYSGSRLTGFMNDPNYFAVIQCAALAVALRLKMRVPWLKMICVAILILSIFGSGSKTGFITLIGFLFLRIYHLFREGRLKGMNLFYSLIILSILLVFSSNITEWLTVAMNMVADRFPIFSRVQLLMTDFNQAVSSGGSSRNVQWETGMQLIQNHPLGGVGIGQNYLRLANQVTRDANIAHNTYIQMAAEWGIPVTSIVLIYIGKIFFAPVGEKQNEQIFLTLKEMFFAFIISSMAVSFNYSRIFWLLLGMLAYYAATGKQKEEKITNPL